MTIFFDIPACKNKMRGCYFEKTIDMLVTKHYRYSNESDYGCNKLLRLISDDGFKLIFKGNLNV